MTTTREHEANAQRAAEDHLDRCYRSLDEDPTAFDDADHHPSAPFCGCMRCIVREVLESAWPHLLELARDEVRATGQHLQLLKGDVMPHDPSAPSHVSEVLGPLTIGQDLWEGGLKVIEECTELSHELVKLCAFPGGEIPDTDPRPLPERVESELGDLLGAIDFFLHRNPQLDREKIHEQRTEKFERFVRWAEQARR